MRLFLTLFLSLCLHLAKAPNALLDSLENEVKKNQTNGADISITFVPPFSHVPIFFSGMSGLGKVIGFAFAYIVFKKGNKVYSKKIVSYYKENDTATTPSVAVSKFCYCGQ